MKRWISAIGVFGLMLAMVGVTAAQEPGRHEHGMAFMATALDLTDAQQEQIKQIHSGQKAQMQAAHAQLKNLHEQLQSLIATDTFDEAKVQAVIAQIQQVQSAQMLEHARTMNAVYKILTPQQKAKAVKLFSSMHEGHGGPGAPDAGAPAPQD